MEKSAEHRRAPEYGSGWTHERFRGAMRILATWDRGVLVALRMLLGVSLHPDIRAQLMIFLLGRHPHATLKYLHDRFDLTRDLASLEAIIEALRGAWERFDTHDPRRHDRAWGGDDEARERALRSPEADRIFEMACGLTLDSEATRRVGLATLMAREERGDDDPAWRACLDRWAQSGEGSLKRWALWAQARRGDQAALATLLTEAETPPEIVTASRQYAALMRERGGNWEVVVERRAKIRAARANLCDARVKGPRRSAATAR